ncbi:hypothetical protein JCM11491_000271 [Sporobolomyces phaffii]
MAPRPRCPVCRSKRWHRDALSGSIVCEEGHLLAGYVQESTEAEYGSQHVLQTRRERKNKAKRDKLPKNDHFHGDRATFLVWQCMQLILREQLRVLIDDLGWPVELEAVTRDLFALLVASSSVPPAPVDFELGTEAPGSYSGPRTGDRYTKRGRKKYGPRGGQANLVKPDESDDDMDADPRARDEDSADGDGDTSRASRTTHAQDGRESGESSEGESSPSSIFSDADDADDERPRRGARSRRTSPITSAPASPVLPKTNPYNPPKPRPPIHGPPSRQSDDVRSQPRLDYLLYLVYLGCVTLRLPVFLSDILHLAETYQIPYLDAGLHLPLEMQLHLSPSNRRLLSPSAVPSLYPSSLNVQDRTSAQAWLARLVNMYQEDWKVEFPEANFPLISGRLCRLLALPPIAYVLALRLLALVPQPISFHLASHMSTTVRRAFSPRNAALSAAAAGSATTRRREKGLPPEFSWSARLAETRRQDWRMVLPELKVASVLVVVAKLLWRLEDGAGPYDSFLEEYAEGLPGVDQWLATVQTIANLDKPGDPSKLWTDDVTEMNGDEIDAYLDFFEDKIVSKAKVPKRMEDLGRFFPEPMHRRSALDAPSPESYLARLDSVTTRLYAPSSESSPPPSRPVPAAEERRTVPICATDYAAHPSSTSAATLPARLARVFVAVAEHVLPTPTALPAGLQGAAPSRETTAVAYLVPLVTTVERVLAIRSVPGQRRVAADARRDERTLWNETKDLARTFVRDQWRAEKLRRKAVDREVDAARKAATDARKRERAERKAQRRRGAGKDAATVKTKAVIGDSSEDEVERAIEAEIKQQQQQNAFKSRSVVGTSDEEDDDGDEDDEDDEDEREPADSDSDDDAAAADRSDSAGTDESG